MTRRFSKWCTHYECPYCKEEEEKLVVVAVVSVLTTMIQNLLVGGVRGAQKTTSLCSHKFRNVIAVYHGSWCVSCFQRRCSCRIAFCVLAIAERICNESSPDRNGNRVFRITYYQFRRRTYGTGTTVTTLKQRLSSPCTRYLVPGTVPGIHNSPRSLSGYRWDGRRLSE